MSDLEYHSSQISEISQINTLCNTLIWRRKNISTSNFLQWKARIFFYMIISIFSCLAIICILQTGFQKVFIFLGTIFHCTNFLRNTMLIFNSFLYLHLLIIWNLTCLYIYFQNMHNVTALWIIWIWITM